MDYTKLALIIDEYSKKYDEAHDPIFEYAEKNYHTLNNEELNSFKSALRAIDDMSRYFIMFSNEVLEDARMKGITNSRSFPRL